MSTTKKKRILEMLKETGCCAHVIWNPSAYLANYLNKLYAEGLLEPPARGLYTLPDSEPN